MMTSLGWKKFYAAERDGVLSPTLDFWLDFDAAALPEKGFLLFPHTRVIRSVEQIVPAALAVLNARVSEVLALGPLHGGPEKRHEIVTRARAGDEAARLEVRGIHPGDSDMAAEEFCLDTFEWLLNELAGRLDVAMPQVHRRHPFLTGSDATTLPGFRRLNDFVDRGIPVIATGDLIHHGTGYQTSPADLRTRSSPDSLAWAKGQIGQAFDQLSTGNVDLFREHSLRCKSDFRDLGPVLKAMFPGKWSTTIESLALVGYEDVIKTPPPTWVSAALISVSASG